MVEKSIEESIFKHEIGEVPEQTFVVAYIHRVHSFSDSSSSSEEQVFGSDDFPAKKKQTFVRTMYLLLTMQFSFSIGFVFLCIYVSKVGQFVATFWQISAALGCLPILFLIIILIWPKLKKKSPFNLLVVILMVASMSYLVAFGVLYQWLYHHNCIFLLTSLIILDAFCFSMCLLSCQTCFILTGKNAIIYSTIIFIIIFSSVSAVMVLVYKFQNIVIIFTFITTVLICLHVVDKIEDILCAKVNVALTARDYTAGILCLHLDIPFYIKNPPKIVIFMASLQQLENEMRWHGGRYRTFRRFFH